MQIILDTRSSDLDALAASTRAWDLDFNLFRRGGFVGQLRQLGMPDMLLTHARFGCKLHQSGTTPPGFRTFVVPGQGCSAFWWLGYAVDDCSILRFGTDAELQAVSDDGFSVCTISLRSDYLENLAQTLGVPGPPTQRGVTRLAAEQMTVLRQLVTSAVFNADAPLRSAAARRLAERLVTYCAAGEAAAPPRLRSRDQAIGRVVEFLDQHADLLPDLGDLCRVAHVSERTLQYAFRERYGMSPNRFVRCWRLNAARRLLRGSEYRNKTIASVAAQCGFHDPSLFARHYRLLHHELPSETIASTVNRGLSWTT
jgi:AraC family ethanolamine operon transcriptional activator